MFRVSAKLVRHWPANRSDLDYGRRERALYLEPLRSADASDRSSTLRTSDYASAIHRDDSALRKSPAVRRQFHRSPVHPVSGRVPHPCNSDAVARDALRLGALYGYDSAAFVRDS